MPKTSKNQYVRYKAPEISTPTTVGDVLPYVFLVGFLRLGIKALSGKAVGRLVLPAAETQDPDTWPGQCYQKARKNFETEEFTNTLEKYTLKKEHHIVETHDGAELDTLTISPKKINPTIKPMYIIKCLGNGYYYEAPATLNETVETVREKNCHYVLFNYRGVGKSTGAASSYEDLVTDALAQAQRLIDDGVDPENIIFDGHSLGGAISTVAAERLHKLRDWKVRAYNDRSFSTTSSVVAGILASDNFIVKIIFKILLMITGWEIDAGDAFKALPETHKDYICVRPAKNDQKSKSDTIISHAASIHMALQDERRKTKDQAGADEQALAKIKQESKRHKMISLKYGAHSTDRTSLISRTSVVGGDILTANSHFNAFFDRCDPNPKLIEPVEEKSQSEVKGSWRSRGMYY